MARAGDTIENPLSGERIHFERTGAETGGAYIAGRITLAPLGAGPPEHIHPVMEERFRILAGELSARVGGKVMTCGPGEELVVPPGTPHRWWNETGDPVELEFRCQPALPLDRFLESVFALARLGLTDGVGRPGPLRIARVLRRHWDVLYLARPPLAVQKPVMAIFAFVAWLLRYPDAYPYPHGEAHPEPVHATADRDTGADPTRART